MGTLIYTLDTGLTNSPGGSELNQTNEWIHFGLGIIYVREKKYEEAIREFQKLIEINPLYESAYIHLGRIYNLSFSSFYSVRGV